MTSREATGFLSLPEHTHDEADTRLSDVAYRLAFGAIGWPWLLMSLWGGTQASKRALLKRVGLAEGSLPNLGSWKADTGFLHRIVDAVEELRPAVVVELGAGASSLVCAKALERNGGGRLVSFDQHKGFVEATSEWLASEGVQADMRYAPLTAEIEGWGGRWYALDKVPERIDLIIIDGPPWAVHPFVRGAAETLFDRLSPGGIVLLDDAARPGERIVASRWRKRWPGIRFERASGSTKGTLVGRKETAGDRLPARPVIANDNSSGQMWRRVAAVAALFAAGWLANEVTGEVMPPAYAASIVDETQEAYTASLARRNMISQSESVAFDRAEILAATGLEIPELSAEWQLVDVQVYPSDLGNSLLVSFVTEAGEPVSLFAAKAETPAGEIPVIDRTSGKAVAYWEEGEMAFAMIGGIGNARLEQLAGALAQERGEVAATDTVPDRTEG